MVHFVWFLQDERRNLLHHPSPSRSCDRASSGDDLLQVTIVLVQSAVQLAAHNVCMFSLVELLLVANVLRSLDRRHLSAMPLLRLVSFLEFVSGLTFACESSQFY